ncbi:MAG: hypothetical protein HYZ83_00065 [Candidatus Omnitrophica bacterium]|nr:hypothetical protein [Candidatus Omnitrophota bacterium]
MNPLPIPNRVIFAAVLMAPALTLPVYADIVKETITSVTTITVKDDTPIYTGPVVEAELEKLTLEDFQRLGTKPTIAWDQFRQYQKEGQDPNNMKPRLYKMKVTRDLTLVDFQGAEVNPELAKVRYESYVTAYKARPGEPYYVYLYHAPVVRTIVS